MCSPNLQTFKIVRIGNMWETTEAEVLHVVVVVHAVMAAVVGPSQPQTQPQLRYCLAASFVAVLLSDPRA